MTSIEAAEFFAKYGNVTTDIRSLLTTKPTYDQLKAACDYAKLRHKKSDMEVDAAYLALSEYHNRP